MFSRVLTLSTACIALFTTTLLAGEPSRLVIPLWSGDAPGSAGKIGEEKVRVTSGGEHVVSNVHRPSITVYLPPAGKATGAAVLICPGGGHRELWMDHEGYNIAPWLAERGVAAIILKYRLAREEGSTYRVDVESLADAQRALRLVRSHAAEWKIDPARVGIMGFSAGGELAALASRSVGPTTPSPADDVDALDAKPAFQGLIYPGNSKSITVAPDAPPAFLCAGYDDRPDISEGIATVYLAFKHAGVPAELHIYSGVGHGFGVRATNTGPSTGWLTRFQEWMGERGFLKPSSP